MSLRKFNAPPVSRADFHTAISRGSDVWFRACLQITGDRDQAADAVQAALLKAWDRRRQFQGQSRLDTWIHKIAVNSALELLRRDRPERWELLEQEPEDELRSPERLHDRAVMAQQFEISLADLTDLERVCVVLKHVEQWRLQEIADEMNASVGTVKQALFRGVKKLRTTLRQAS